MTRATRSGNGARPDGTRGGTLVEILVGTVIALVAIVVVQTTFVATLAIQRSATASAEAEQAALLAIFVIGEAVAEAGAGIASASVALDTCPVSTEISSSLRPVSVLIVDSGSPDRADTLTVRRAMQSRIAAPAAVAGPSGAGAPIRVRSPDGFAAGDRFIAIGRDGTCGQGTVLSSTTTPGDGVTELVHDATTLAMPASGLVLNLGPASAASTLRFDVGSGSLRSADLSNADPPNPLVANVVNLKVQYGIDRNGDGTLDDWVTADGASGMGAASVLGAPAAMLARIVALRFGVVTRSESFDPQAPALRWVLFDCPLALPSACPGRLEGTIPRMPGGGYRYATRELVIALYNTLWNRPA